MLAFALTFWEVVALLVVGLLLFGLPVGIVLFYVLVVLPKHRQTLQAFDVPPQQ